MTIETFSSGRLHQLTREERGKRASSEEKGFGIAYPGPKNKSANISIGAYFETLCASAVIFVSLW